jgi:hypothetical protein
MLGFREAESATGTGCERTGCGVVEKRERAV